MLDRREASGAVLTNCVVCVQSYDILPSSDIKSKTIREREARALLCGLSKKSKATETIQGSILLPNAGDEVRRCG